MNNKSEIFLISLAIFCQCFSYADWYFIKTIFNVVDAEHAQLVLDDFLPFWFLIYFFGKLIGTYCFGKMTLSLNYFKIVQYISFVYLAAVLFILIVLLRGQDFYSSYQMLYASCFLTSLPFYALTLISIMYLFERHPSSRHILISVSILFALFSTRFMFRFFMNAVPHEYIKFACLFTAIITCLSLFIYAYVAKHYPSHPREIERPASFSVLQKLNCAFIATGWNLGFSYYHYFLAPYMKNIYVMNDSNIGGTSTCYIALLLSLPLTIPISKKFGTLSPLTTSLVCMLVLGVSVPFMDITNEVFFFSQCALGFFSACTFSPILMLLYRYYQNTKNLFATIFCFAVGATISTLIFSLVPIITKPHNFTFGGMIVFVVCVLLCIIGAHNTKFQKISTNSETLLAA